jgi:hypothetical protein
LSDKSSRLANRSVLALAAMRVGIGGLAWARPDLAAKLFGMPAPDGQEPYLWRLFGARDVAVGLGTIGAAGSQRRTWATFGLLCDAADGAAAALGHADGHLPAGATRALITVPAAAVGLGVWARSALRR